MVLKNPDKYQVGKTTVYFIRHGDRIHIPNTLPPYDFSLSKLGTKQAKDVAKKFALIKNDIDVLYSSPMKRAFETAMFISKKIGKKVRVIKNFYELNKEFYYNKVFTRKYWQSLIHIRKAMSDFNKILEENKGKVIVIVAHGGLIRTLILRKLGLANKKIHLFDYYNCHISLVRFKNRQVDYIHYLNSKELL